MSDMTASTDLGEATVKTPPSSRLTAAIGEHGPWWVAGWVLTVAVAAVPVVRMVRLIMQGSSLQYADYWMMLPRFLNPDGSLDVNGLLTFQNEHPVVVAQFIYWLNVRLFSGSNVSLGLIVVGIVLGQLAVVALMIRRSSFRPVEQMTLFALASALLFDPSGSWNFAKAMSGTAWLTANLFAVIAVYLRSRDRRWAALAFAMLAASSYGTGAVAWVAVIAVGCSKRPFRQWWREWPYALGLLATIAWYRVAGVAQGPVPEVFPTGPADILRTAARLFGAVLGLSDTPAEVVGAVAVLGIPVLALVLALRSRDRDVSAWIGLATFGWLAALEIAAGRLQTILLFGEQGRYASLPALGWIGLAGMGLVMLRSLGRRLIASGRNRSGRAASSPWLPSAVIAVLVVAALFAGQDNATALGKSPIRQAIVELALQMGIADGKNFLLIGLDGGAPIEVTDLLKQVGHYPFNHPIDDACGPNRKQVDPKVGRAENPATREARGSVVNGEGVLGVAGAVQITGYVVESRPIRCVFITNGQGVVVGPAKLGIASLPGVDSSRDRVGFVGLATGMYGSYLAYVLYEGDDQPYLLGGSYQLFGTTPPK